jgi:hypothetical protein
MTSTEPQPAYEPALYDVVYAVLAGARRHDSQGRPVSTGAWNRDVAAQIAAAVSGSPAPPPDRGEPMVDPRATAAHRCIAGCAAELRVDVEELLSPKQGQIAVMEARQITGYVLRRTLGLSLTAVGRLLGRDHSTVLHWERKVVREMAADEWWRVRVGACVARVGSGLRVVG